MVEVVLASTVGGFCSALRYHRSGGMQMFRVFMSSTFFAFFAGRDLSIFAQDYMSITLSRGASCFLLAYVGSTLLDRLILLIRAYRVTQKW